MSDTREGPTSRERAFKGAVAGKARRKAIVTGYLAGTEPLVEVRLLRDHRDQGKAIDLTFPQAREMVRLLLDAIEAAADLACHDRNPLSDPRDRASQGGVSGHARSEV